MQHNTYSNTQSVARGRSKDVSFGEVRTTVRRGLVFAAVTFGAVVLCGAIVLAALVTSSFTANGAYKAVAIFLAIIMDSNLLSMYFRWAIVF